MAPTVDAASFPTYLCSWGKLFRECPFWGEVTTRMRSRYPDFSYDNNGGRMLTVDKMLEHEETARRNMAAKPTAYLELRGWSKRSGSIR